MFFHVGSEAQRSLPFLSPWMIFLSCQPRWSFHGKAPLWGLFYWLKWQRISLIIV